MRYHAERGNDQARSYRDCVSLIFQLPPLLLILLFYINIPNATKRDFGAGPRSVVGVRVPDAGGPNREPEPLAAS